MKLKNLKVVIFISHDDPDSSEYYFSNVAGYLEDVLGIHNVIDIPNNVIFIDDFIKEKDCDVFIINDENSKKIKEVVEKDGKKFFYLNEIEIPIIIISKENIIGFEFDFLGKEIKKIARKIKK